MKENDPTQHMLTLMGTQGELIRRLHTRFSFVNSEIEAALLSGTYENLLGGFITHQSTLIALNHIPLYDPFSDGDLTSHLDSSRVPEPNTNVLDIVNAANHFTLIDMHKRTCTGTHISLGHQNKTEYVLVLNRFIGSQHLQTLSSLTQNSRWRLLVPKTVWNECVNLVQRHHQHNRQKLGRYYVPETQILKKNPWDHALSLFVSLEMSLVTKLRSERKTTFENTDNIFSLTIDDLNAPTFDEIAKKLMDTFPEPETQGPLLTGPFILYTGDDINRRNMLKIYFKNLLRNSYFPGDNRNNPVDIFESASRLPSSAKFWLMPNTSKYGGGSICIQVEDKDRIFQQGKLFQQYNSSNYSITKNKPKP